MEPENLERSERLNSEENGEINSFVIEVPAEEIRVDEAATVSLLAGGYCGFHRGKPVPFANRAPSWIFEARAPGYERASAKVIFLSTTARPAPPRRVLSKMAATKKRTPGFLAEEKLQRLQVGYQWCYS